MNFFRRNRRQSAPAAKFDAYQSAVEHARAERVRDREKAAANKADLIAHLSNRYYIAHAIVQSNFAAGISGGSHLIGVCSGIEEALAAITGKSVYSVQHKMSNGVPLDMDWIVVNDAPNGVSGGLRVLHDGIREPVTERLDMLHRAALKADGHPMYDVLYNLTYATV